MKEKAIQFGRYKTLIGVVTEPEAPRADAPAIVLPNAGLIHRIGPNRIYVKLARALAEQGFRVLRFDLSGIGDSLPRPDAMPVEQFLIDDLQQAMDNLTETYGTGQFVLAGHCAGAYHAIRAAAHDPRVAGVVMINPDGGEAEWVEYDKRRKLASYYSNYYGKKSLLDRDLLKRLLTFKVNYGRVFANLFRNIIWSRFSGWFFRLRRRFQKQRITEADEKLFTMEGVVRKLFVLDIRVLLIYSQGATSLERIQSGMGKALDRLTAAGKLRLTVIPGADHIFSPTSTQTRLEEEICVWLETLLSSCGSSAREEIKIAPPHPM